MAGKYKFSTKSKGIRALKEMGYRVTNSCVFPSEIPGGWPRHIEEDIYNIPMPIGFISDVGKFRFRSLNNSGNAVFSERQEELESRLAEYFSRNGRAERRA